MSLNSEEIVQAIDRRLFIKSGRQLKDVEKIVLRGAWEAKTYEQIADTCQYSLTYIKQAAAPRLWKLLSDILEENISKTNFRLVIESKWDNLSLGNLPKSKFSQNRQETGINNLENLEVNSRQDWNQAPEINVFYGRNVELEQLKQWLIQDNCRLIAITGMGGMGKTALAVRCAQQVQDKFDCLIWRNLQHTSTLKELIRDLMEFLAPGSYRDLQDLDEQISSLIVHLRHQKCLIILDTATAILQSGSLAGNYREEYQNYGKLLRRLGKELHQSCLILISREKPKEIALMEGENSPVRSLSLKGLGEAAKKILQAKQLSDEGKWSNLIAIYRGNPLALNIVASTIKEIFGGKVATFLRQETIIFGELNDILDEQFESISVTEQEILYWLAIEAEPISFSGLRSDLLAPITPASLIEAIESLLRRSLIERNVVAEEILFSLQQPVVIQYVLNRIRDQIAQEIQEASKSQNLNKINLLRTIALVKAQDQQAIPNQLLLRPIIDQLCIIFKDENLIEQQLRKILSFLEGKTSLAVGYAKYNLEHLLLALQSQPLNVSTFGY